MIAPVPARRQIGRGEKVRAAVISATVAELVESGFATLTVESVARRAGVHKTTVYRRWADRYALVLDSLTDRLAADIAVPDTGSIESDLDALARGLIAWLGSALGQALVATLPGVGNLPELEKLRVDVFRDRLRRGEAVVRAAVDRGELGSNIDPAQVIRTLVAPIYLRIFFEQTDDDALAARAVAVTLAAARSGVLNRKPQVQQCSL